MIEPISLINYKLTQQRTKLYYVSNKRANERVFWYTSEVAMTPVTAVTTPDTK